MNKRYQRPFLVEFAIETHTHLLAESNRLSNGNLQIESSTMEEGDGSDAVKSEGQWDSIWD